MKFPTLVLLVCAATSCAAPLTGQAQTLYVSQGGEGQKVSTYNALTGALIKDGVIRSYGPFDLAYSANNLYVSSFGSGVSEYNAASGTLFRDFPLSYAGSLGGLALSGNKLYFSSNGVYSTDGNYTSTVGVYDATTGAALQSPLVVNTGTTYCALVSGNSLFLGQSGGVVLYDATTGALVNRQFITGLAYVEGLALSGNRLYVSDFGGQHGVGVYDSTTGAPINAQFITGLTNPKGMAVFGDKLYVADLDANAVKVFDAATGIAVNPPLVIAATQPEHVVVVPAAPAHPSFFSGETPLNDGVYYLLFPNGNPFGYYSYLSDLRYVFHVDLGYEYVFDAADGRGGVYLYDFKSNGFFYTSPIFPFPYLYDFALDTTLYYYPDPSAPGRYNTSGVRYFYNFKTGKIITK